MWLLWLLLVKIKITKCGCWGILRSTEVVLATCYDQETFMLRKIKIDTGCAWQIFRLGQLSVKVTGRNISRCSRYFCFPCFRFLFFWFDNIEAKYKKVCWGAGGQKGRFRVSTLAPRKSENDELLSFLMFGKVNPVQDVSIWVRMVFWSFLELPTPSKTIKNDSKNKYE